MVAAAFGVLCELTNFVGALTTLGIGVLVLINTPRNESVAESALAEYGAWLICVVGFAATAIAIAPLVGEHGWPTGGLGFPTAIALCIFSPLLGTIVYMVERYLFRAWS